MNVTKQNSKVNEFNKEKGDKGVASKGSESQPTQVHILESYTTKLISCQSLTCVELNCVSKFSVADTHKVSKR